MNNAKLMFVLLAGLLFVACSSSDDDGENSSNGPVYTETSASEAPVWKIDWTNNQERPNWTDPNASAYENWTIMMVQIEDELAPYVSEGDLMAIFLNDELRGLASPAVVVDDDQTGSTKFLMKAYGNETGSETVNVKLSYYCQKLKHMFTLSANISMDSDETTGTDEDYIPPFTLGSAKYPAVMSLDAKDLLSKAGIKPAAGDLVSAFVGDECRGVCASPAENLTWVVYGRAAGEDLTVKYYQAATGKLFTFPDAFQIK
jgi:hypothetical protein